LGASTKKIRNFFPFGTPRSGCERQAAASARSFGTKCKLLQTRPIQIMNSLKNVRVVGSVAAALGVVATLAGSAMSHAPFAFLDGF
jgi:hypothetical protein